ncbi:MAG: RluA family pseudouridine synthase [Acidimicrobiales bacterium]
MTGGVVPMALDGERLDRALCLIDGISRREAADLIDRGAVLVAGAVVNHRSRRVRQGETVEMTADPAARTDPIPRADPAVAYQVVHSDDHLVVVDKPAGLVTHPGAGNLESTLVSGLLSAYPEMAGVGQADRPGIVHRLDAGTSGLMVVARTSAAFSALVAALARREVNRRYLTLVRGEVVPGEGVIDAPIGRSPARRTAMAVIHEGRSARTRYQLEGYYREPSSASFLECILETGRTHQIRVHLAAIGHPVLGDSLYGTAPDRDAALAVGLHRPFLHSWKLDFMHPDGSRPVSFESALPPELAEVHGRFF